MSLISAEASERARFDRATYPSVGSQSYIILRNRVLTVSPFRLNSAVILKIVYDMDVTDMHDEYIHIAEAAVNALGTTQVPGAFWVEFIPMLRYIPDWVPGIYFKRWLKEFAPLVVKMIDGPFDIVKQNMVHNEISLPHSFCLCSHLYSYLGSRERRTINCVKHVKEDTST